MQIVGWAMPTVSLKYAPEFTLLALRNSVKDGSVAERVEARPARKAG
jgi:hypothetical protein